MGFLYLEVLIVQGAIVPIQWAAFWRYLKPYWNFFVWAIPLAMVVGFGWDTIMQLAGSWVWLSTIGIWVGVLPIEDMIFMVEIFMIPATCFLVIKEYDEKRAMLSSLETRHSE